MKAIQINKFGALDVLEEVDIPIPNPGRNQVRIKIKAMGFNPVDSKMRSGVYSLKLPAILGVDFSGVVDAKGDLVRSYELGDEVYGLCSSNGAYAEFVCENAHFVAKKPKNLSFNEAAAVPVTYLTAFQALIARGAFQQGRPLFISGASGGVGSATLALSKVYRSGPVFTLSGSDQSRAYLMDQFSIPKSQIVAYKNLSQEQIIEKVMSLNKKERFYFTLDFVGGNLKDICLALTDVNGHMASIVPEGESFGGGIWNRKNNPYFEKSLSLHIIFLHSAANQKEEKAWAVYNTVLNHLTTLFEKEGLIPPHVQKLGPLSLETVKGAHTQLESGHTFGKLVMTASDSK